MISAIANHIWQSTLFACVIGYVSFLLRNNGAAVRYRLWLVASVKFLVPFSLLIAFGGQFELHGNRPAEPPQLHAIEQVRLPLAVLASPARSSELRSSDSLADILFALWLCGFVVSSVSTLRRWRQVRSLVRNSITFSLGLPISVVFSRSRVEPGVCGVFRPVFLLPQGLRERLSSAQFESIVAHELEHVRRRDNLTYSIHLIVEALLWFYPPVYWIGKRLIHERERACDEAVLRQGCDARVYAEAIVGVCRFSLRVSPVCVSGVSGADLKKRLESIVLMRIGQRMSLRQRLLLFAAGSAAMLVPLGVGLVDPSLSAAQEADKPIPQLIATSALPQFEVASIKPSSPGANLKVDFAPGGKLYITNATLRFLIKVAYDIGDDQLAGGPKWVGAKRFDVAAIPDIPVGGDPTNMAPDQMLIFHKPTRLRLQRLLADRFQLELRKESTPMPVFALAVASGGPKNLVPSKKDSDQQLNAMASNGQFNAAGVDMATLAKFLSEGQTGRPVVDKTGLGGRFDFHLSWTPENTQPAAPGSSSSASQQPAYAQDPSIFSALQQQLGLKLVPETSQAERLVVVRADLPSAN
ncbi:M56 family metallopeptidase [Occallatibacter savannae]|uniref:M56 family metallopeptidase n=1 Tax=Occallatibacter savannae TaxID=1002691 RepID=UPI000D68DD5B|nr:M56 family metallopeptidase [Occallatibacter savannae]